MSFPLKFRIWPKWTTSKVECLFQFVSQGCCGLKPRLIIPPSPDKKSPTGGRPPGRGLTNRLERSVSAKPGPE